jgi:ferredoxin
MKFFFRPPKKFSQVVPIRASEEQPANHDSHACGSGGTLITHRILFKGEEVSAMHGETLRTALLKTGKVTPHNAQAQLINCRGLGTCGTCAVEIKGAVEPKAWNTKERLRLNFPPHSAPNSLKLRLACQVAVTVAALLQLCCMT